MLTLPDLKGLWRRTFLQHEGQDPDRTTQVFWLQGPRFYVDLRQPAELPRFDGVRCLHDLSVDQLRALATQEGFAGALALDSAIAEWQRQIDFQPASGVADRARLQLEGQILTERGTEASYVEQWHRETDPTSPGWGAQLVEVDSGRSGFLVRAADQLMFARARPYPLPPGGSLRRALDAADTLQARRNLLDFEISLGSIEGGGHWRIDKSSLPFKQGRTWRMQRDRDKTDVIAIDDLDSAGAPLTRRWKIVAADVPDGLGFADTPIRA